ncbi:MAG: MgtC/SapB family protein, partial [Pseudoflavonifractor sp.]
MAIPSYVDPIAQFLGDWAVCLSTGSILFRIALSFLFAAVLGCERAHKRHSAGLRTFILVSVATTMAILLDLYRGEVMGTQSLPVSAAALVGIAIISGNSFLYSSKNQLKGLTTAVAL